MSRLVVQVLEYLCWNCTLFELNCDSKAIAETHKVHVSRLTGAGM